VIRKKCVSYSYVKGRKKLIKCLKSTIQRLIGCLFFNALVLLMLVIPQQETTVPDREISTFDPLASLTLLATRPRQKLRLYEPYVKYKSSVAFYLDLCSFFMSFLLTFLCFFAINKPFTLSLSWFFFRPTLTSVPYLKSVLYNYDSFFDLLVSYVSFLFSLLICLKSCIYADNNLNIAENSDSQTTLQYYNVITRFFVLLSFNNL
jgi:hypothetical protein